jgi:hypothetical protein
MLTQQLTKTEHLTAKDAACKLRAERGRSGAHVSRKLRFSLALRVGKRKKTYRRLDAVHYDADDEKPEG